MTEAFAHPEAIVSTDWVTGHLNDPSVVVVEIDADLGEDYRQGHIPGAAGWDLHKDLEDFVTRDIPGIHQFEALMGRSGIAKETTVVLYGDGNNRSATWALWIMKYYRHGDVRIMNGGRQKWVLEGRPVSMLTPSVESTTYRAGVPDRSQRAMKEYVVQNLSKPNVKLLDTRTKEEYTGELSSARGTPQPDIYRKGHIPGAVHIQWDDGATDDGTFKSVDELRRMYSDVGLDDTSDEVIPYCRLGMRGSYSWFVLKYILGFERVRNYDGSWTEWGNSTGVPIETD